MDDTPDRIFELTEELCYYQKEGNQKIPVYPYVVAVTGHRSFAGPGQLPDMPGYTEEQIKTAFKTHLQSIAESWHKEYKNKAPLILLSGMADGADQLAVEAAFELDSKLNIKVIAVLPMKQQIFRKTVDNKARFDSLLDKVWVTYSLPPDPDKMNPEISLADIETELADVGNEKTEYRRQIQYAILARFLALHSHLLFALWDGIDQPDKKGGTSSVVHFKLEGNTDLDSRSDSLTYSSIGPVIQLLLPRNNDENRHALLSSQLNTTEIPMFLWTRNNLWDSEQKIHLFPNRNIMDDKHRCTLPLAEAPEVKNVLEKLGKINADHLQYLR